MGGKAFAAIKPPISTPRLAPPQYLKLRNTFACRLRSLFSLVETPIEGPGKLDHGDLDFVVSEPRFFILHNHNHVAPALESSSKPDDAMNGLESAVSTTNKLPDSLSTHLPVNLSPTSVTPNVAKYTSVEEAIAECLGSTARSGKSYAVPIANHAHDQDCLVAGNCAQVDVTVVQHDMFDWHVFQHSHGDFFQIIGPSVRQLGLVITESGFYAVNRAIEPHDKKRGRLFLSSEPTRVLKFLRLDLDMFYGTIGHTSAKLPFANEKKLFEYALSMRGFDPGLYRPTDIMKHRERRRLRERSTYRDFVSRYLPLRYPGLFGLGETEDLTKPQHNPHEGMQQQFFNPELSKSQASTSKPRREGILSRETCDAIREEAIAFFDKRVEWNRLAAHWNARCQEMQIARLIKETRKANLTFDIAYANGWIGWLAGRSA